MKVTYVHPAGSPPVTVEGAPVDGRYGHMYLHLDTPQGVLRIPREVIVAVEGK